MSEVNYFAFELSGLVSAKLSDFTPFVSLLFLFVWNVDARLVKE